MKNEKKIYILHGWTYRTEKWQPFLGLLKKAGYEPVLLKIPGLTAPLDEVWRLEEYVAWLEKTVEKEKGKVILLGHSNGGRIILSFAASYPQKVAKLILIDSAGIYHNELPIRVKRLFFSTLAKAGKKLLASGAVNKNDKEIRKSNLRTLLYRFAREHDYEQANPKLRETMRNLIRSDIADSLLAIKTPTTIIWGEHDKITPLSDGKIMHTRLSQSSLHSIAGARHSPMFTHAEEVAEIIISNL